MTLPFVFISAWNDSGGGFVHRLLDGHPQIRCYPFEVQLGTGLITDGLSAWYDKKYRWPTFPDISTAEAVFESIINNELWDAVRGDVSSKFKDFRIDLDLDKWRRTFAKTVIMPAQVGPIVHAYLDSFFDAWSDRQSSDEEKIILGHCPVMVLDWDRILRDDPTARMINVIRSPFTGFVDMRRRHPTLDPASYGRKWALVSTLAFVAAAKDPARFRTLLFDRLIDERIPAMKDLADWLGIRSHEAMFEPSWNGRPLSMPGPFGGVPQVAREHELENLAKLGSEAKDILATTTDSARSFFQIPTPK